MFDLLIILLYILVAVKILLSFFSWLENRFNLLGNRETLVQTDSTQIIENNQTLKTKTQTEEKGIKSAPEKSLDKQPEQTSFKSLKKEELQSIIRIEEPSEITDSKKFEPENSGKESSQVLNSLNKSRPEPSKEPINDSILPAELKLNQTEIQQKQFSGKQSYQAEREHTSKELVSLREFQIVKREKQNAIQKLMRYVQKANQQKQILTSEYDKSIQAILNENKNLENKIKELKDSHSLVVKQLEQKHSEVEVRLNKKIQQAQTLLEQNERAHQQELQNSRFTKEKHSQFDQQIESTINETVNGEIPSEIQSNFVDPMTQARIQQLRSELEFCQSQLQQAYESETKLKEQVEELKNEAAQKAKAKAQISITDVINHPEYLRIKEKLQKYENGTSSSQIRSPMRSEITPRGERLSRGGVESRISERRSFIPSSRIQADNNETKHQNSEEVFSECNFLNQEAKGFLLEEIKRIKKLPIKKTKLIFKLDKISPANPHEFIDNIPNIVLLIELTNKKVLGAFTQTAFSKEDGNSSQNTSSIVRSRLGNNKSLILDLTNRISFNNNNPSETIIYDENAIVWGKDELIIKNDEPSLLYSSFGAQDGVYSDGKYTVDDLLGGNQGFERISQYEFYRIYIG